MRKKFVETLVYALIVLLALSVLNTSLVFRVKANPTTVEVINPLDGTHDFFFTSDTMPVGSYFVINITVFDVTDLICWQIKLSWDPSLLEYREIWLPSDHVFKGVEAVGGSIVTAGPVIEPGSVAYAAAFIFPDHWSFNGTGTLCQLALRITQEVSPENSQVYCDLQFANISMETFLINSLGADIPFTPVNGNYRYRYVPIPPHGPTAHFAYYPTKPQPNEIVTFDGTSSTPGWDGTQEAPIISYEWDFESDGIIDDYGVIVTHAFPATGTYLVTLKVTDTQGLWNTETHAVQVKIVSVKTVIEDGVAYLAAKQNPDGSWGSWYPVAETGLAVLKLEEHAVDAKYGYGLPSPFDPRYPYRENVERGLNYIFAHTYLIDISIQPAGDPDTNGNGKGVYFLSWEWDRWHTNYETSIAMMAIAGSRSPEMTVDAPGSPVDGWTYKNVLQDAVDFIAFGQNDADWARGGWGYYENHVDIWDGQEWWHSDQSNSGWVVFGLGFAESPAYKFACTVPEFVKTELNIWIDYIQNDVDGDLYDGGAGYSDPYGWVNILKTGHLLYMMSFVGDTATTPRVQDAVAYLVRWWNDPSSDPGWRGWPEQTASYHAMFNVMKGLFALGIHEIDGIDWQTEFEHVLEAEQLEDGSWPNTLYDWTAERILSTTWALLTLQKVVPTREIPVYVDIKPGSWPNPINVGSDGVFAVAICGTKDFDVTTIDPATIKLIMEGLDVSVSPIRWSYQDVATPYTGEPGGGHALGGDGYLDLVLHFDTQDVVDTLGLGAYVGTTVPLVVTGKLYEELGGIPIKGQDYVRVQAPKRFGRILP